jgi:orotidine-5'-phosphate decarboxylase
MLARNPLIVAIDVSNLERAEELASSLAGHVAYVKAGMELFTAAGPAGVERIREHAPVMLDLKLHDIPNTVYRAAHNVGRLGAELLTVHALGGIEMVRAAVEGAAKGAAAAGFEPPGILGVTVLSSLAGESLASPASLAFEAISAGATGVVVSGEDVREVREAVGPRPVLVVPGIRPRGAGSNDHVRILSPAEALERGADLLVVGRPITEADDPAATADAILRDVGAA